MYANRAKMTTPTLGTGTLTLGTASMGYQSFAAAGVVNGETIVYVIEDGLNWEISKGVYSSVGPTLTRTLIQSSTGSLLNLSGLATVFQSPIADDLSGPEYWAFLTSNYTLTSTTATQKLFNASTNGALSLDVGIYEYRCQFRLTGMSATSGNGSFSILGGGSAVISANSLSYITGQDNVTTSAAAQNGLIFSGATSPNPMVTATTATDASAQVRGMFRVTTAGTIIPSIALNTAAVAIVVAGSHFVCKRRSTLTSDTFYGAWT